VYVCVCVCTKMYVCACANVCVCVCVCVCACECLSVCACVYESVCEYTINKQTCTFAHAFKKKGVVDAFGGAVAGIGGGGGGGVGGAEERLELCFGLCTPARLFFARTSWR